jgi:alpha-tubulin suppressor-like RCC1 family protein
MIEFIAGGYNHRGQLGNNSTSTSLLPVATDVSGVMSGEDIVTLSAGYHTSFAISSNNTTFAWGENDDGEFGNDTSSNSLVPVYAASL